MDCQFGIRVVKLLLNELDWVIVGFDVEMIKKNLFALDFYSFMIVLKSGPGYKFDLSY